MYSLNLIKQTNGNALIYSYSKCSNEMYMIQWSNILIHYNAVCVSLKWYYYDVLNVWKWTKQLLSI